MKTLFFLFFLDLLAKKTAKILMKDKKNLMFPLNKENVGTGVQSLNFYKMLRKFPVNFFFVRVKSITHISEKPFRKKFTQVRRLIPSFFFIKKCIIPIQISF